MPRASAWLQGCETARESQHDSKSTGPQVHNDMGMGWDFRMRDDAGDGSSKRAGGGDRWPPPRKVPRGMRQPGRIDEARLG